MTVLSAQSIRRRRQWQEVKLIDPFVERSVHAESGMSYGLSSAGYDVRVKQGFVLRPGKFRLASTVEYFRLPDDLIAFLHDKSSLARQGIAVQNTVFEPGWQGHATLEIANHGPRSVELYQGQPIAQVVFQTLDEPTESPYRGKYQFQADEPVAAKFETEWVRPRRWPEGEIERLLTPEEIILLRQMRTSLGYPNEPSTWYINETPDGPVAVEAFTGFTKKLPAGPLTIGCPVCQGTGEIRRNVGYWLWGDLKSKCLACNGTGKVTA